MISKKKELFDRLENFIMMERDCKEKLKYVQSMIKKINEEIIEIKTNERRY